MHHVVDPELQLSPLNWERWVSACGYPQRTWTVVFMPGATT